tara:strand:+ start:1259 stop:1501 length:243 start_codon:yes stop_codon:yes gene_type:complete
MLTMFSFLSVDILSKEKKKEFKPFKVNKKVEKKGDYVVIRTETIYTKSQWKELKSQSKVNKAFFKKRKKEISMNQKKPLI